jgi:hypothetical protein
MLHKVDVTGAIRHTSFQRRQFVRRLIYWPPSTRLWQPDYVQWANVSQFVDVNNNSVCCDRFALRRYVGDFVCSIRHGTGSYSLKPVVDTLASTVDNGFSETILVKDSGPVANDIGLCAEDSAAGVFVFNSFACGAVARALQSAEDKHVLPVAFCDFFRAFWGQQQLLIADGVMMPGHITKFVPILDTAANVAAQGCTSMWAFAFDGGAAAACAAAAASIAHAPFCSRYIEEVGGKRVCAACTLTAPSDRSVSMCSYCALVLSRRWRHAPKTRICSSQG